jgi:uncharacterized protein YbaR (Trm112 family)
MAESEISVELLEILVCPKSHGSLEQRGDWLYCEESGLRYPIRDGIPIMLIDEAEEISDVERPNPPTQ